MTTTIRRLSLPLLLSALLSACSVLPRSEPQDIYRMPASAVATSAEQPLAISLRIARPSADDVLRGTRIAVQPRDHRFNVYQGARWSAPAPLLWRDHLVEAFQNDGRIPLVSSDSEGLQADIELAGALRAFHTEYRDGKPRAVIRYDALLVDAASKRILASRRFSVSEDLSDAQVPAVVEALGRAGDRLARELIDWTVEQIGQRP